MCARVYCSSVWVPEPQQTDLFTSAPCKCVCMNFHANFMQTAWLVFVCLVFSSCRRNSSDEYARVCIKYMRPVSVVDLCHIHIKPHIVVSSFVFLVAPVSITFHYVPDFMPSSMVVKTWLLRKLLAFNGILLIEFQLNDNKFKRTLRQYTCLE